MNIPEIGSKWTWGVLTAEVVHVESFSDTEWVTYKRTNGDALSVNTITVRAFAFTFDPEPTFFQLGKTYEGSWQTDTSYEVIELHQMENPATPNSAHAAVVRATNYKGSWIEVMNITDFKVMREVTG